MPKERVDWEKLKQNFDTYGLVTYYIFLYILVLDSYRHNYDITKTIIKREFFKFWFVRFKSHGIGLHLRYILIHKKMLYQLHIRQNYALIKWYIKLSGNAVADIKSLQKWMLPMLQEKPDEFILSLR
jgi:hypothetical protein